MAGRGTAVVLGGSLSGLMAAAVLARAFERVVLVERDALGGEGARKGAPQVVHNHNLTPRVTRLLERSFPGILEELRARGATVCDAGGEGRWYLGGERMPKVSLGEAHILARRPVLDARLVARLRATAGVTVRDETDVCGLLHDAAGARVAGVRVVSRVEGREEELAADLVVDATGRGSRTPRWLGELGYDAPEEERLEVGVSYVTRCFQRRPSDLDGDRFVVSAGVAPDLARGAVAFAVDEERWMILAFAYGERPPADLEGFRAFTARLAAKEIGELTRAAEPLEEVFAYQFPRSTRRRYDLCARLPADLIVVGDALSSTNPSWGLGVTSAALQLELLEALLAKPGRVSERWFAPAIRATEEVWGPIAARDLLFDRVEGSPSRGQRLIAGFFARAIRAASSDPALARVLLRVVGHVESPAALFRPDRALRILLGGRRGAAAGPAIPAHASA